MQMMEVREYISKILAELEEERNTVLTLDERCQLLAFMLKEKSFEQEFERESFEALLNQKKQLEDDLARERAAYQAEVNKLAEQLSTFDAEMKEQQQQEAHRAKAETEAQQLKEECQTVGKLLEDATKEIAELKQSRELLLEETEYQRYTTDLRFFEMREKYEGQLEEKEDHLASLRSALEERTSSYKKREEELVAQLSLVEQRLKEVEAQARAEQAAHAEDRKAHATLRFGSSNCVT